MSAEQAVTAGEVAPPASDERSSADVQRGRPPVANGASPSPEPSQPADGFGSAMPTWMQELEQPAQRVDSGAAQPAA